MHPTDRISRRTATNPCEQTDYHTYAMSMKERVFYTSLMMVIVFFVSYVFYKSVVLSFLFCPLGLLYPRVKTRELIAKRKDELNIQFNDMLYSLSSSLSVGKSIEHAFVNTLKDLEIIYPNPNTSILIELDLINKKIEMNETIENGLLDFAKRAHLEDIDNFTDTFLTCKRTGGNMIEVIRNTSNIINDKIEIRHEIDTLIAEKKFEQKVLNILPIGLIILLSVSAGDFMKPVFDTWKGKIAMTISIGLLVTAYWISKKITHIRV